MKTYVLSTETIDRVNDGHCNPWNYDYKEYIFNDKFTKAYSIRIPQGTYGIKAQLLSNGTGIAEEYDRVYLDNGSTVTSFFDVDNSDEKYIFINSLKEQLSALQSENAMYRELVEKIATMIAKLMR